MGFFVFFLLVSNLSIVSGSLSMVTTVKHCYGPVVKSVVAIKCRFSLRMSVLSGATEYGDLVLADRKTPSRNDPLRV